MQINSQESQPNYESVVREEVQKHGADFGQLLIALNNMFGYPEGARILSEYLKKESNVGNH